MVGRNIRQCSLMVRHYSTARCANGRAEDQGSSPHLAVRWTLEHLRSWRSAAPASGLVVHWALSTDLGPHGLRL